jgi:hypothetical protein
MADRPAAQPGGLDGTPVISVAELLTRDAPGGGGLAGREVTLPPGVRRDPGRPSGLVETAHRVAALAWRPQFRLVTVAGAVLLAGLLANTLLNVMASDPRPTAAQSADGGYPAAEAPAATDPGAPAPGQLTAVPVDRVIPAPARVAGSTPLPAQPAPRPAAVHPAVKAPTAPATAATTDPATAPTIAARSGGSTTTAAEPRSTESEPTGLDKVTDSLGNTLNGLGDTVSGLGETVGGLLGSSGGPSRSSSDRDDDSGDPGSNRSGGLVGGLLGGH